jgi:preprotein translocase subunit YajC
VDFVIVVVAGLVLLWLFVVLPQRRRAAAHNRLVAELAVGDEIMTAGGLYGTVTRIGEDDVAVEVAPGVEVRLARRAVAAVLEEADSTEPERSIEEIPG